MKKLHFILILFVGLSSIARAGEIAITMDDPTVIETPLLEPLERNQKILAALDSENVKATLFVCGMRIDNSMGHQMLKQWDERGHWLSNHSYSHRNYGASSLSHTEFSSDVLRGEKLISGFKNFQKLFRFPFLKEGDSVKKRDSMRSFLKKHGYQQGFVTIDASDWYINDRMMERLKTNPKADLSGYRQYYLDHLWDRAQYYDTLAQKVLGKNVKHTLLIHHNLLNALFLKDALRMFKDRGWKIINASEAFTDPIFNAEPKTVPAGEGIVWALAKETGRFDSELRYPAEDGPYENDRMDALGL